MADSIPAPDSHAEVDWNAVRITVRDAVRAQLGPDEPALVEDVTQQALIGVLRALRREPVRDVGSLARTIARATAIDEIRRRRRERKGLGDLSAAASGGGQVPAHDGDARSSELLWFLLVEYLRARNAPCHPLALLYAEKGDWKSVATAVGTSYDAVRKQWSRCVQAFKADLSRDPGTFEEWLDDV